MKYKTKWYFDFENNGTLEFKFEGLFFVFHFNLKNEKPNLPKQIYYETSYHLPLRNYNK